MTKARCDAALLWARQVSSAQPTHRVRKNSDEDKLKNSYPHHH
ncbi:hypothetical protein DDI_2644 [Dickeya dianthicola RNS04.9]|nr:hypothetical protein DDI_2644 [Dickeya dianthicola RNS04.9]